MTWQLLEQLIETRRLASPDAIAIDATALNHQLISYAQLEKRVSMLAKSLTDYPIYRGDRVALVCEHRINAIVAYLALFRLGLTVMPLDFNDQQSRRDQMIANLNVRWQLNDTCEIISDITAINFAKNFDFNELKAYQTNFEKNADFIFFSSGSSNKPKAIGGSHEALSHYINWQISCFNLQPGLRYSQLTLLHYDACLRDIFTPLCSGGTICLPAQNTFTYSAADLNHWLVDSKINVINTVPSVFSLLVNTRQCGRLAKKLKYVFLAGEKINQDDLKTWYEVNGDRVQLVNLYGATETVMTKLYYMIRKEDAQKKSLPIGMPIDQVQVQIKSKLAGITTLNVKTTGEIRITVPYLLPGYMNHDDKGIFEFDYQQQLTHYNTGDIGSINQQGLVEFAGRADRQIKINAIRIDLDEIEIAIKSINSIKQCAAVFSGKLVYVYVVSQDPELSTGTLKKLLLDNFSSHFGAVRVQLIDQLPLTNTGKTDYQLLSQLAKQTNAQTSSADTQNSLTQDDDLISLKLQSIWCQILDLNNACVPEKNQNFFDAGGDSLTSLQFISAIESAFNVKISIAEFVGHASIAQLTALLWQQKAFINSPIVALNSVTDKSDADLNPIFWCLHAPGGSIVPYASLARKLKNNVFMGIQYPAFCGDPDLATVEEMAEYYVRHMLSQPEAKQQKEFHLGAWSSGSLFALEVANQLMQKGYQVPVIIMIDSPLHYRQTESKRQYQIRAFSSIFNYLAQGLDIKLDDNKLKNTPGTLRPNKNQLFFMNLITAHFLGLQFDKHELAGLIRPLMITDMMLNQHFKIKPWLLSILPKRLMLKLSPARRERLILKILGRKTGSLNTDNVLQYMDVFRKNMQAIFNYKPIKIDAQDTKTRFILLSQETNPDLTGWRELGYDIEYKKIPGNHFTVFKEPNVGTLASLIEQVLNQGVTSAANSKQSIKTAIQNTKKDCIKPIKKASKKQVEV